MSFLLTPGNSSDCKAAIPLLAGFKAARQVLADKAYDSDEFRDWLKKRGSTPIIILCGADVDTNLIDGHVKQKVDIYVPVLEPTLAPT